MAHIADLIAIHLSDLEFEVDKAFDGKEGLLKVLNNSHKIILLDIRSPGLNGMEVCNEAAGMECFRLIPSLHQTQNQAKTIL